MESVWTTNSQGKYVHNFDKGSFEFECSVDDNNKGYCILNFFDTISTYAIKGMVVCEFHGPIKRKIRTNSDSCRYVRIYIDHFDRPNIIGMPERTKDCLESLLSALKEWDEKDLSKRRFLFWRF